MTTADREPRRRRRSSCAAILLVVAGLGWWLWRPSYIELDVAMPPHSSGVVPVWHYEARQRVRIADNGSGWEWGCDYVLRRFGMVDPDRHEWKSRQAVFEHLDRWLTARGWEAGHDEPPWDPSFPEDSFVRDSESVRVYRRAGDKWGSGGRVLVAVFPWSYRLEDPPEMFAVVLASTRPSFWRRLQASFD